MKHDRQWEPTNIGEQHTKFSRPDDVAPREFCALTVEFHKAVARFELLRKSCIFETDSAVAGYLSFVLRFLRWVPEIWSSRFRFRSTESLHTDILFPFSGWRNYIPVRSSLWAGIAQSVYRLATSWTVRGSSPGDGKIFRTRPYRPWGPSSLLCAGYRVFPGGKATGACRWPPTHLAPRLKKE